MSHSPPDIPTFDYIAFIDEAGDPGTAKVKPIDPNGASEWMVMGAVLIPAIAEQKLVSWIARMRSNLRLTQRKDIHFRDLNQSKKLDACSMASKLPIVSFAILSNKINMRGYTNAAAERKFESKNWFYNWCIRIVLERLSHFVASDSLIKFGEKRFVKIIFSERGGHSYRHTETYQELLTIQGRSNRLILSKRVIDWDVIHWKLMEPVRHKTSAGCQLADIVTSAFYQAADANRLKSWTTNYAETLQPIMAVENVNGVDYCADYGVTLMPWSMRDRRKLSENQKTIFRFYGYVI